MTRSAVYVTYDGILDPLGASQVVPYVLGLADTYRFTIVSFEKAARWTDKSRLVVRGRLAEAGVTWRPLRYHARPRVPATLWDVARGAAAVRSAVRRTVAETVHCRGEIAMLMARQARLPSSVRLLLDRRGFFADERVETGSWVAGGAVDRAVRSVETANLARADGLVVLTQAGLRALAAASTPLPPHRVIPTCADTAVFRPRDAGSPTPDISVVYSGSLGTWYMAAEMMSLGRALLAEVPGRALFLTPDITQASAAAGWAEVRSALPEDVPAQLRRARASFFLIRATPAKRASCPTKLAESLATGLPVVANRGIGDVDEILEGERVGVMVDAFDEGAYRDAARRLATLLADPEAPTRCRRVAERRFALGDGISAYRSLYAEMGERRA